MKKQPIAQKAIESELDELAHEKMVFVIRALIASGHVSESLVRDSIKLSSWVKIP